MHITEILSAEHRVIEVVISCLERIANEAEKAGQLNKDAAERAIDFIRNFADRCHHGKEENHLFTSLAAAGMPTQGGPVGVMLNEHQTGREFVKRMDEAIPEASNGVAAAVNSFVAAAHGYAALLRAHIQKEDQILFPMAENVLPAEELDRLKAQFEIVESEHMGEGTHERYLQIARDLAVEYGEEHEPIDALLKSGTCCCSHG